MKKVDSTFRFLPEFDREMVILSFCLFSIMDKLFLQPQSVLFYH